MRYVNSITNVLLTLNSAVNFLIYCLLGKKFRRIFVDMFCNCVPCYRRTRRPSSADQSDIKLVTLTRRSNVPSRAVLATKHAVLAMKHAVPAMKLADSGASFSYLALSLVSLSASSSGTLRLIFHVCSFASFSMWYFNRKSMSVSTVCLSASS